MRDPGVDQDEMNLIRQLSEAEAERLWEGNPPAGKGMDELAAFFRELRQANAAEPGPELESAHLQAIMAEVSRVRSARPAQTQAPPAASPGRTARRGLGALGLKLAAAGLGAVMLMGGLAAADVLPDPVQKVVSRVGEVVTPFDFPEPPGSRSKFGENVSRDAKDPADPGVSGKEVSEDAKSRGADKPAGPDPAVHKPAHPAPPAPANPGRGQGQVNRARPEAPGGAHRPAPGQTGRPPKGNVGVDPPGGPAGAGISSGSGGGPASGRGSGSDSPGPDAPGS